MDYSVHNYDSTVEPGFFDLNTDQYTLTDAQANGFLSVMLSTIELRKLCTLCYESMRQYVPLASLTVQYQQGKFSIGEVEGLDYPFTLTCGPEGGAVASVTYHFEQDLGYRHQQILQQLHAHFAQALQHALAYHHARQAATRDMLTGLGNRSGYEETLTHMLSLCERQRQSLGILVIDLDKFKAVNDTFGHQEGDQVLVAMANVLRDCLREADYAFRFGGDEFCCLLPGSTVETNALISRRITHAMGQSPILNKHFISCSIGSTIADAEDDACSLFERADIAMYRAKKEKRHNHMAA
ncbi:GGDEF domain-containing protein [Aestuariibacter salexigens]|uniref:GGDEF domain-containing protein n=1 Tax=Aestuariibacter salexigens TaxID=226010 RepID=UPI0004120FC1|nr:GGDEF domain-containing protein [Aestuariibacter salexigens]